MDVADISRADRALVQQYACLPGKSDQHFRFVFQHSGYIQIIAEHSGKCFDIAHRSTQNGARLRQWDCIPAHSDQHFSHRSVG